MGFNPTFNCHGWNAMPCLHSRGRASPWFGMGSVGHDFASVGFDWPSELGRPFTNQMRVKARQLKIVIIYDFKLAGLFVFICGYFF